MIQNQSISFEEMKHLLKRITAKFRLLESHNAELDRKRTERIVAQTARETTSDERIAAAKARARATYAKIDNINSQSELSAPQIRNEPPIDLKAVRIDDLETLFNVHELLPEFLRKRIETIHAKIHWKTKKGKKGYFNVAVHENHIPIDKKLTILAHLDGITDGRNNIDYWLDSVTECGLYPKVKKNVYKKGKKIGQEHQFHYTRRCQDAEHCDLCNYVNITDGLKILLESYDKAAFYRAASHFAITVAPRANSRKARAIGRILLPEDWIGENPHSMVYRESYQRRIFKYPDAEHENESRDWHVETRIRRFLGAVQFVLGKLVKNGWLDGIRAKAENSIEFMPFASHQHWHGAGSSNSDHNPQGMADFIKDEVDEILAVTCPGLYADVMVAAIPTPTDLQRWIKYMNKTVDLVNPVDSVYNRFPEMRRGDDTYNTLQEELRRYPERSRRVFGMVRFPPPTDEGRTHSYMLRRRYVCGNHRFGVGSILSEPERHRQWRKRHSKTQSEVRKRSKLQRVARKLGFRLEKCTKRSPDAEGYGTHQVVEEDSDHIAAAGKSGEYGLSLRQCENFLKKRQKAMKTRKDGRAGDLK